MLTAYLKRQWKLLLLLAGAVAVFAAVFALYSLPVEAVAYAGLLCLMLGLVLFALGYSAFLRRHRELEGLLRKVHESVLPLPPPRGVLEADYQALLRRAYDFGPSSHLLSCGAAVLNVSDGTLDAHGQRVELTRNECRILQLLLEHKGEIVSRDALMTRLWESDSFVDENTLTVNIARLRRKLEAAGLPDFIRTRKGAGYLVEG